MSEHQFLLHKFVKVRSFAPYKDIKGVPSCLHFCSFEKKTKTQEFRSFKKEGMSTIKCLYTSS